MCAVLHMVNNEHGNKMQPRQPCKALQNVNWKSELWLTPSIHLTILVSIKNDTVDKHKIFILLKTLMINVYKLHLLTGDFCFSTPKKLSSQHLLMSDTGSNGLFQAERTIGFSKGSINMFSFSSIYQLCTSQLSAYVFLKHSGLLASVTLHSLVFLYFFLSFLHSLFSLFLT